MATLHHHPLCPHSRFVRLVLGELGLETDLIEENIWERSEQFLMLDPQGRTPVFVEDQIGAVLGAGVIAEYLDETRGLALGDRRLLPDDPRGRVEVRRLMEWFNGKMYAEVTDYLVTEKVFKRLMSSQAGGGAPDTAAIRAGRSNIRYHLAYVGYLMRGRNWLAGTGCPMPIWRLPHSFPVPIISAMCRGRITRRPSNGMRASNRVLRSGLC